MKKENVDVITLKEEVNFFDGHKIQEVAFDLKHINRGWDGQKYRLSENDKRSNFESDDIVNVLKIIGVMRLNYYKEPENSKYLNGGKRYSFYVPYPKPHEKLRVVVEVLADANNKSSVLVTMFNPDKGK